MNAPLLPSHIGSVPIERFSSAEDREYSDGDSSEEKLLKLFQSPGADEKRLKLLSENPEWALKYHLAYTRENLLNWYSFKKDSVMLEVGSGCGALTGLLINKCGHVDALDISPRRSLINAHRNREATNLTIIVGNLQDFAPKGKYDYVTSIGVLEYAGRFINTEQPYLDFLKQLHAHLKSGGQLVLAIENRLGIKYWSGSREDHTGRFFDSIEGYPNNTDFQTFGRLELDELLKVAGFAKNRFYYPLPDYKMPIEVYSDDYQPGINANFSSDLFPTPAPDQDRQYLFSEDMAMNSLSKNRLFPYFANSFLVFAEKG